MSAKPEHYDVIRKPIITEKTTGISGIFSFVIGMIGAEFFV